MKTEMNVEAKIQQKEVILKIENYNLRKECCKTRLHFPLRDFYLKTLGFNKTIVKGRNLSKDNVTYYVENPIYF